MAASPIPEKILNFRVYNEGSELLGIAEGNFPSGEFQTVEVKGAGIAGTIDAPALGQMQSLTIDLTWRTVSKSFMNLLTPGGHALDMYADLEQFDPSTGEIKTQEFHVYMKARTKIYELGKLAAFDYMETKTTHEIYYYKAYLGGQEVIEIDKYNYIYKINGVDYLSESRKHLGMV